MRLVNTGVVVKYSSICGGKKTPPQHQTKKASQNKTHYISLDLGAKLLSYFGEYGGYVV